MKSNTGLKKRPQMSPLTKKLKDTSGESVAWCLTVFMLIVTIVLIILSLLNSAVISRNGGELVQGEIASVSDSAISVRLDDGATAELGREQAFGGSGRGPESLGERLYREGSVGDRAELTKSKDIIGNPVYIGGKLLAGEESQQDKNQNNLSEEASTPPAAEPEKEAGTHPSYCPNCGVKTDDDASFCKNCGKALE